MALNQKTSRSWGDLYSELLESISNHLSLRDLVAFSAVCRHWRSTPSCRSPIIKFSKDQPWFMLYDCCDAQTGEATCYLLHESHPDQVCTVKLPDLRGATCLISKSGWLLAHRDKDLFFCSPFTLAIIKLPQYPFKVISDRTIATFSGVPISPGCTAFIITYSSSTVQLRRCRVGDQHWHASHRISFYDVYVGRLTLAQCCNCCGDDLTKCKVKNYVYFYNCERVFLYNFARRRCFSFLETQRGKAEKAYGLYDKLVTPHGWSWLPEFVSRTSISVCALNMRLGEISGLHRDEIKMGEAVAEGSGLKAAWVEAKCGRIPK